MASKGGAVDGGIGKKGVPGTAQGRPSDGGNAAIDDAIIIEPFVGRVQQRAILRQPAHRGIQGKALPILIIPMVFHIPIGQGVEPEGALPPEGLVHIQREPFGAEAVDIGRQGGESLRRGGHLGHPIHHPAATAAPEEQRIGAPKHFHAFKIVEGPEILHVVSESIEKEVRGGVLSPDGELVAMVFPLSDAYPRGVLHHVGHAYVGLLPKLLRVHHGDGLGHIQKERRRFHPLRQRLAKVGPAHHDGFDGARRLFRCHGQGQGREGQG